MSTDDRLENGTAKSFEDRRSWFVGSDTPGPWHVKNMDQVKGPKLTSASYVDVTAAPLLSSAAWSLSGVASHLRYTTAAERIDLNERHASLGREEAGSAVLIPIKKSDVWWSLAQDERLAIYARSKHTMIGLDYLPNIARKLYHCRDLGEPFDFLTWFEFAFEHAERFAELLTRLRATEEWTYVERETDIWLTRAYSPSGRQAVKVKYA